MAAKLESEPKVIALTAAVAPSSRSVTLHSLVKEHKQTVMFPEVQVRETTLTFFVIINIAISL